MAGVSGEASKTAQTVVEALKSTPMMLALVIFNILFMALTGWTAHESGQRWERLFVTVIESCGPPHDAKTANP